MDADGVPPEKTAPTAPSAKIQAIGAWSLEDDVTDFAPFRLSRSRSALLWGVGVGLLLGTVSAIACTGVTLYGERGLPAAAAEPPPQSTAPPPPLTPDQEFLTLMHQIGIEPQADAAALIRDGHQVCQELSHYQPFERVVADVQAGAWVNPGQANIQTSRKFALAAIEVYCPQYQVGMIPPQLLSPK
jgi:Protein of unknown function (DUF732)